jgi:hypothetical protein
MLDLNATLLQKPYGFSRLCALHPGTIVQGISMDATIPSKMEISDEWNIIDPRTKKPKPAGSIAKIPALLESKLGLLSRLDLFTQKRLKNNNLVLSSAGSDTETWFNEALWFGEAKTVLELTVGTMVGVYMGVQVRINNSTGLYILLPNGIGIWI